MELSINTKETIMRRVHRIFFVRRVLPMLLSEIIILAFVLQKIAEYVFVNQVLWNATAHTLARSPFMMFSFFGRAFINTEIIVQALIVCLGIATLLVAKDMRRGTQTLFLKT